jgi:NitT/TauT family transport system permease protein
LTGVREPVSHRHSRLLALAGFLTLATVWCVLSYGGIVPDVILPSPTEVLLGLLMGTFPRVKHFLAPLVDPLRFLPISALVPLFLVWFGIEEAMKIMLLFAGTFVYLLPLVVEAVDNVEDVYLQTAVTLGANRSQLVRHVLVPGSLPAIGEALRVMNGIGWTYVILAEIVNARYGLGHLITVAGKRSHVDQIFAGVLVILFIGVATDWLIRMANRQFFAWKR